MSDASITALILTGAILFALVWVFYLAAGLVLAFTGFVVGLPLLLFILMFVLLPPPFMVLLVGCVFVLFGLAGRSKAPDSGSPIEGPSERGRTYADAERRAMERRTGRMS
jgi:hypothetical protein